MFFLLSVNVLLSFISELVVNFSRTATNCHEKKSGLIIREWMKEKVFMHYKGMSKETLF